MTQSIDITDQTFGDLTAIRRGPTNRHGQSTWLCHCACGNQRTVATHLLRQGRATSCGCKSKTRFVDLTGQVFGKLTVVEPAGICRWLCRCECGATCTPLGANLRSGNTTTCGCGRGATPITQIGDVFGKWTIVQKQQSDKHGKTRWLCRCECGVERTVAGALLRSGRSKSCGCGRLNGAMGTRIDLTGQTFGDLTVIQHHGTDKNGRSIWLCRCSCGTEQPQSSDHLRRSRCLCNHSQKEGYLTEHGYRMLLRPDHPNARKNGYIAEHILVMTELLGRALSPGEEVHHKNTLRDDNGPQNLELWRSGTQPKGGRVEDLIDYVVTYHRTAVELALRRGASHPPLQTPPLPFR